MTKELTQLLDKIDKEQKNMFNAYYATEQLLDELKYIINPIPTMPFGKHKGTPLNELPKHYMAWLFSSGAMDKWENRKLKDSFKRIIDGEGE